MQPAPGSQVNPARPAPPQAANAPTLLGTVGSGMVSAGQLLSYVPGNLLGLNTAGTFLSEAGGDLLDGDTIGRNMAGESPARRSYAAVGTVLASKVGIRQLDDARTGTDAVDGHKQSKSENVVDGVLGAMMFFGTVAGIKAGISSGWSRLFGGGAPCRQFRADPCGQASHAASSIHS